MSECVSESRIERVEDAYSQCYGLEWEAGMCKDGLDERNRSGRKGGGGGYEVDEVNCGTCVTYKLA